MKSATKAAMSADEKDDTIKALTSNERVIKAQVRSAMDTLLLSLQDRAMTEMNVLAKPELISSSEIRDSLWGDFLSPEDADAAGRVFELFLYFSIIFILFFNLLAFFYRTTSLGH